MVSVQKIYPWASKREWMFGDNKLSVTTSNYGEEGLD